MGEASPENTRQEEHAEELSAQQVAELSGARAETPIYGGQALMEGVMMRSPRHVAAAIRREDGEIIIKHEAIGSVDARPKILKLPLVRGVLALWDAFGMGLKYLTFSGDVLMAEAEQQESIEFAEGEVVIEDVGELGAKATHEPTGLDFTTDREKTIEANRERAERILKGKVVRARELAQDEAGADTEEASSDGTTDNEEPKPAKSSGSATGAYMWLTMGLAFVIALGVFMFIPHALSYWFTGSVLGMFDPAVDKDSIPAGPNAVLNIVEGFVRLAFFFTYVLAIGQMRDIRRVFQYHGAEHKVVHAVEKEADLTVDGASGFSTIHPRCGTNFVAIAICVAIVLLSFLNFDHIALRLASRIIVIPFVAAIAYEILKLAGRHCETWIMRLVTAPGALLQRITTREPDEEQIEVSLVAMREVVSLESRGGL